MMQRSISMPSKPLEEKQKRLQRSEEIEELCEEQDSDNEGSQKNDFKVKKLMNRYEESDLSHESIETKGLNSKRCFVDDDEDGDEDDDEDDEDELLVDENKYYDRVICKNGRLNIHLYRFPKLSLKYCKDIVTTLIELKWSSILTIFFSSFFVIWLIFTIFNYIIAYMHGDILSDKDFANLNNKKRLCIRGGYSFISIFIYTMETHTTIGFGEKYPDENCPEGIILFLIHIIIAIAYEGAIIGIIYAKISMPPKYVSKYKFSKKAVICNRDDKLCLIFRLCDPGEHQTINTKVEAFILTDKTTIEGEVLLKVRQELTICNGTSPVLVWPETVCHIIDENSPLNECIDNGHFIKHFEIFVSLTGCSPSTGQITESKTSYLPYEILWNHRFVNIITYDLKKQKYIINYRNFNKIIAVKK